ncbi:MAG: betaine/proline/choline family ABC transporter ATP-binding protein [Roseovarius sp.]
MPILEIDRVSKVFGPDPASVVPLLEQDLSKDEILARTGHVVGLRNVKLDIEPGEIFVIMGLSGSGKSTLIRHLNRLIDPTAGEIRLQGRNILSANRRELMEIRQTKLSMVFQKFGLMPHRTVIENVGFGLEARGEPRKTRDETARKWISRVGLAGYEDRYPSELSGGMQQRVGLARGLATAPEILLMDEAFSALDPLIRHDMQSVLLELQKELNKTIVFITHDLDEALAIGDRIAILQDGMLVQVGAPSDIILRPATGYVRRFVGNVNRPRALRVRDVMAKGAAGEGTERLRADQTLEEALPVLCQNPEGVGVADETGEEIGRIDLAAIVGAISPPSDGKDDAA